MSTEEPSVESLSPTTIKKDNGIEARDFFLVQFAHTHTDFQLAELQSILDMFNLLDVCLVHQLPNEQDSDIWEQHMTIETESNFGAGLSLALYSEGIEAKKMKVTTEWVATNNSSPEGENGDENTNNGKYQGIYNNYRSFLILSFPHYYDQQRAQHENDPNALILEALSRCVLVRSVIELWGTGRDMINCANNVKNAKYSLIQKHCVEGKKSWKLTIHTFGSKYSREEQNVMRSHFNFLPFTGDVKMVNPDEEFILIREVEVDLLGSPLYPRHSHKKEVIPENDARPPLGVYYGRYLRAGLREGKVDKYCLKKRKYLGPTSMDTELSMIMTNLGQVQKGSFCFDPFVGTGSILLTCALEGAYCFGTDIDIRVLRGKGSDENIYANFKQFNLPRPEIVRSDNAIYHRHYQHQTPPFDNIVCDPPYGIRAGARKSGSRLDQPRPVLEEHRHDHIAQTKPYAVSDVMADLLDVSARTLVMGGRLVYIIPSMTDFDPKTDLPRHDCLECIHICYQPLQINLGRRMVTMKKVREYDESQRENYLAKTWVNGPESAEKCANIREKLIEAARLKPGYEEKSELRRKKRKAKKEELKKMKRLEISCKESVDQEDV